MTNKIQIIKKPIILLFLIGLGLLFSLILHIFGSIKLLLVIISLITIYFLFKKPFLGILLYIPFSLYLGYAHIFGFTPRNYLMLLFIVLIIVYFKKERFKEIVSTKYFLIMSGLMLYAFIFSTFLYGDRLFIILRNIIQDYGLQLVLMIFVYLFLTNLEKIKKVNHYLVFFLVISCFVGIGQFLNINLFWELRELISSRIVSYPRIAGLSFFNIQLTYQIVTIFPISLILYHLTRKKFYLFSSIIIFITGILTKSRSCFLAIFITSLIFIWLTNKKLNLKILNKRNIIIFVFMLLLISPFVNYRSFQFGSEGSSGRLALYSYAFLDSIKHPLGVGLEGYFDDVDYFYPLLEDNFREASYVQNYTSHNHYFNVLLYYGWPIFLLAIYFTASLLKTSYNIYRKSKNKTIRYYSLALFLSFIGFTINSLFHNSGFFMGESLIFVLITQLIILVKLNKKNVKTKNISSNASL